MWASGKYARVTHAPAKANQAANFTRPASAPEMMAVEMIAKVTWKPMSMALGYPLAPSIGWPAASVISPERPNAVKGLPNNPAMSVPA